MRHRIRLVRFIALGVFVSLLLACSSVTPPPAPTSAPAPTAIPAQPTTAPAPTQAAATAAQPTTAPTTAAATADTSAFKPVFLTVNAEQQSTWVRNFNPFSPDTRIQAATIIYEPMMIYNKATADLVPWLATGYEWNADNTQLTFKLRQ